jgi:hypothetical protein
VKVGNGKGGYRRKTRNAIDNRNLIYQGGEYFVLRFEEHMSTVFNPEDGSLMFLRNTGGHLPAYSWKAEYSHNAVAFLEIMYKTIAVMEI